MKYPVRSRNIEKGVCACSAAGWPIRKDDVARRAHIRVAMFIVFAPLLNSDRSGGTLTAAHDGRDRVCAAPLPDIAVGIRRRIPPQFDE